MYVCMHTCLVRSDLFFFRQAASKFQRLQHLHLYLWILQYGLLDSATLSSITFPWISAVQKVDNITDGVLRWRMIIANMPLSLLIIIVGVHLQVITAAFLLLLLILCIIGNSGCPKNYMISFNS